jgi:hypothetical protein
MAQQMLNLGGNLSPEQQIEQQQIARQQRMAELLMQQGQQTPQGQMVSGRYVAPSFFQYAAPLLQGYVGRKELEKVEQRQLDMAKKLRADEISAMTDYMQQKQGRPAQPAPTGYELIDAGTPAIPANPQAALANLYTNPRATQAQRQFAFQKMNEGPMKVGVEDVLLDPTTLKPIYQGAGKPRAPLQIDTGTAIELRDPANPTIVLERIPKSQMPTAGQVVERDDGTFLIDTRTGQARPVMGVGGQPLMGGGKPLTETQSNAVAFGARALEANRIATDLEKKGVTNIGKTRTIIGAALSGAPFVGDKLEQTAISAFNPLPEFLGGPSGEQQQTAQARRNFISAVLRKESGAAISIKEFADEEKKYFPEIGDLPEQIKQKQDARRLAIEALKAQAGPSGVRQINQITSQTQGGGTQSSQQDQDALNWANSNPNDPRSAQIKQRLGR